MFRIVAALSLAISLPTSANDAIGVPGTDLSFVPKVQQTVSGKTIDLTLTGTALRTKTILNIKVYGMASYVQAGSAAKTGEDVAAAETVKLFHLVMERKVTGNDFLTAFREAIGDERVNKEFSTEFKTLKDSFGDTVADKGEYVLMCYAPGVGTRIRIGEKVDVTIPGAGFGRAIWEVYMGKTPIDQDMKKNLISQISK